MVTLLFYAAIGLFALTLSGQTVFLVGIYLHAMTFVFLGMFVAMSAGEVLFNKEEADILLHRPVSARALLWAKIAVLLQVSLWLAAAFNLVGLFVGVRASDGGWLFPIAHAVSTSLEALFCTATVVMVYQLCLRWLGRQKLESFMTATQVLVSVAFVLGSQLVPQLMIREGGRTVVNVNNRWIGFIPPSWFAGIDDAVAGSGGRNSWMLALLAVAATAAVLWLAFGKLAADYQSGLQTISESGMRSRVRGRQLRFEHLVRIPPISWWLRDSIARASFLLSAAYLVRDRETKLRVFPGIAPMLVFPILALLPRGHGGSGAGSFGVAFVGSYLALLPLLALGMLELSQQWQAGDVFRIAPMPGPAALTHGARRAVLVVLTLPVLLLFVAIALFTRHPFSQLSMMLPGVIALPAYAMFACVGGAPPLSRPPVEGKAAGRSVTMVAVMISAVIISGITVWSVSGGWFGRMLIGESLIVGSVYFGLRTFVQTAKWASID